MRSALTLLLLLSTLPLHSQSAPSARKVAAVQTVSLTSDSVVSTEDFQRVVRDIQRNRYSSSVETRIADVARSSMRDQGYFKAEAETVATQVLNETTRVRTIVVTLRIREGEQYRVSRLTFANNKAFPGAELRRAFAIKDGDTMSDQKIREGLENMRHLYASKGYMEVTPVPQIVADDGNRTLSITMDVNEGPQFTINGLTLEGDGQWPTDKAAKLQALSQSYSGSHDVEGFVDEVKKVLAELFPGYTQIDSLVGTLQGTEKHIVTVNVIYPSDLP